MFPKAQCGYSGILPQSSMREDVQSFQWHCKYVYKTIYNHYRGYFHLVQLTCMAFHVDNCIWSIKGKLWADWFSENYPVLQVGSFLESVCLLLLSPMGSRDRKRVEELEVTKSSELDESEHAVVWSKLEGSLTLGFDAQEDVLLPPAGKIRYFKNWQLASFD